MTISVDNPQPATMAAFRPKEAVPKSPGLAHGAKTTVNTQRFRTPIKIEFNVASSQTAFNLPKEHCAILKLLVAKDPTMEIVPSKAGQATFDDLLKFPANADAYNQLFDHSIQKQPTEARKVIIAHSLITSAKFTDLKFQNPALMEYMYKHKIWLKFNPSESLEIAALGFIQDVHPRITFHEDYRANLEEAIHLEMTADEIANIKALLPASNKRDNAGETLRPDIKLEVIARSIAFGNGAARIKTDAFEVRVPLEIRMPIKEILTRLGNTNTIPEGRFIPYGLAQSVGANVHKQMIRMQNDFLADFRVVPVFGLLPAALAYEIDILNDDDTETRTTVERFIKSQPGIRGLELTQHTPDIGKIFLKTDSAHVLQVRAFVDDVIKQLYESGSIPAHLILPTFNPPRRGDAIRTSTAFQSYATALANLGNPQEEDTTTGNNGAPPARPTRRNLNVLYDLEGDFPNLPRRQNQNERVQQQSETPHQAPSPSSQPAINADTLNKFRTDLKNEFITMIQNEVKNQIQQERAAMQAAVTQVATKLDTMNGTIREAIGSAIRDSMRQGMPHPAPPPPQQYQQVHPAHQNFQQQYQQPVSQHYSAPGSSTPTQQKYSPPSESQPNSQDAEMHEGPRSQAAAGGQN